MYEGKPSKSAVRLDKGRCPAKPSRHAMQAGLFPFSFGMCTPLTIFRHVFKTCATLTFARAVKPKAKAKAKAGKAKAKKRAAPDVGPKVEGDGEDEQDEDEEEEEEPQTMPKRKARRKA